MPEGFDCYHQWLGIPPSEQPPSHYRLLGIAEFEQDLNVIGNAADRQMAHVKQYATGQYAVLSQQLLNELSQARVCLLTSQMRSAYDAELRQTQQHPAHQTGLPPLPVQPIVTTGSESEAPSFGMSSSTDYSARSKKRRNLAQRNSRIFLIGQMIASVAGLAFGYYLICALRPDLDFLDVFPDKHVSSSDNRKDDSKRSDHTQHKPKTNEPKNVASTEPNKTTPVTPIKTTPATPIKPPDIEPPTEPPLPTPLPETTHSADAAPKKLTFPDKAARQQALRAVRDLFKDKYAAAKTREGKVSLAELLLEQADGLKDDPVAWFVVLDEARELAVDAGNQELALRAVRDVVEFYAVDELAWKMQLLLDTAPAARTVDLKREHSTHALNLTKAAVEAERFELAERLVRLAKKLLQRSGDVELRKRALAVGKEVKKLHRQWAPIIQARKTLAENPDDPAANLVLGQHLCLHKDDWQQGLPLLAKSSDPKLQAAAQQDLTNPTDPAAQIKAGDTWNALSQSDQTHQALAARAHHWYIQASLARAHLVLYYPFDQPQDRIEDRSGNGNLGVNHGAKFTNQGVVNGAFVFDGVDSYVECLDNPSLDLVDGMTIALWAKFGPPVADFAAQIIYKAKSKPKKCDDHLVLHGALSQSGPGNGATLCNDRG